MNKVTQVCYNYHKHKVKMIWSCRFDKEARCELRKALRKLQEIKKFGSTIQAY